MDQAGGSTTVPSPESVRRLKIAEVVTSYYRQMPELDFLCVGGSTAIGTADLHSDLDLHVGFSTVPSEADRQATIRRILGDHSAEPQPEFLSRGRAEGFRIRGVDVSVFFGSCEQFMEIPGNRDGVMGTHHESSISEYFDAICLFDARGTWGAIKAELDAYPVAAGRKIIVDHTEAIVARLQDDCLKAVRSGNLYLLAEVRPELLDSFVRFLCALNKRYYRRPRDLPAIAHRMALLPPGGLAGVGSILTSGSPRVFRAAAVRLLKAVTTLAPEAYPGVELHVPEL